jgi:hypothetical protein
MIRSFISKAVRGVGLLAKVDPEFNSFKITGYTPKIADLADDILARRHVVKAIENSVAPIPAEETPKDVVETSESIITLAD